jgi:hypothetical protein
VTVFHHTLGFSAKRIAGSGHLKLSTRGLAPGEPPAVWFTAAPVEPTIRRGLQTWDGRIRLLSALETECYFAGWYRFTFPIESAPISWAEHRALLTPGSVARIEASAAELRSDVRQWRLSHRPISTAFAQRVEAYADGAWHDMRYDTSARHLRSYLERRRRELAAITDALPPGDRLVLATALTCAADLASA